MPLVRAAPHNGSSEQAALTILVVEDEVLIRAALAEFLRESGYRVLEAVDVAGAKAVLNAGTAVDLVFSDVVVPGTESGYALARWIRKQHPLPADIALLQKPYRLEAVLAQIRRLFAQSTAGHS